MRDIKIHAVLNGYVCKVGCQKVVFTSLDEMLGELRSYLEAPKPAEIEEQWLKNSLNSGRLVNDNTTVFTGWISDVRVGHLRTSETETPAGE